MSEAELYILRARLNGGIQNKAARGELRRGLPVGFVWGEADGEVRLHPDEAVVSAIRCVFARFAEMGSARRVWLWFRSEGFQFPLQMHAHAEIRWVEASYTAIHHVLSNPVYAGAYVYGKTRRETVLDASGARTKRIRHLPRPEWQVFIPEHHTGYIDWPTYEANQRRLAQNTRPQPHRSSGAVREAAPFCKAWPAAAIADAACTPTIADGTQHRDIIAPARRWLRAAASFASTSAASRSTTPSRKPSSPRWSLPSLPQPSPPPSNSRRIARPRSSHGGSRRNARATKPSAPSGAIAPSIRKTVSWRAASSASGKSP